MTKRVIHLILRFRRIIHAPALIILINMLNLILNLLIKVVDSI